MLNHAHYLLEDPGLYQHEGPQLLVGGRTLEQIASIVGQTPFFAYDRSVIASRVERLRKALPASLHLHYAMKANPHPAVVSAFRGLVDGFDVASQREMVVALASGMPAQEISFAGPSKRDAELAAAIAAGVCINCESFGELERIEAAGKQLGQRPRVALRVNPAFQLKGAGMKMGGLPAQFGMDEESVPDIIRWCASAALDLEGLHIYAGSQNLKIENIHECFEATFELATRLLGDFALPARSVNIGGGLGIPYFPGNEPIDPTDALAPLHRHVATFHERFPDTHVVMELGRYLVGEAGVYVTRVIDVKESRGVRFAMVDGGLHHHLANSGNFGQVLRKNYPVAVGNRLTEAVAQVPQVVVGPLCTPLDLVADKVPLPLLERGDLVVVFLSGAYGPTASPAAFLSHPEAAEILL